MLVKCNAPTDYQVVEGNIYLVIEIYLDLERKNMSFRIIDENGCPTICESTKFITVSEKCDGLCFSKKDNRVIITHEKIKNSSLNQLHIDGFWGLYFDEDNAEAEKTIQEVVNELSKIEDIVPPIVKRY